MSLMCACCTDIERENSKFAGIVAGKEREMCFQLHLCSS
jgi:hypothetical protein